MKVIIDFRKYDGVIGGVEQGAIQLTRHICNQGDEVALVCKRRREEMVQKIFGKLDGLSLVPLDVDSHVMSIANARIDSRTLPELAVTQQADLIHFFYNWSFPFRKTVPTVLTVHDVIPFTFREAMGFWRNHFLYRPALRMACRLNDAIATVSEYSRQDIAKKVGAPPAKIRVVPNGLREPAELDEELMGGLSGRFKLKDGYILNVGGIHERKNIVRLIESFAGLVRAHEYKGVLVITGSVSGAPYQEKMKKLCDQAVAASGVGDRIVFTGFITEDELDNLLRQADLLVYPSLYEGFGIPILEAMKVGTPVVTSNVTAMPEVAGDAALLVDPLDPRAMTDAMHRVLSDPALRQTLTTKGYAHAAPYTWDHVCAGYMDLYRELIARAPRSH
ncbi:MAG: glycosyltransferase family 1 protein [Spartobacteria bacterium]|nr:glycosyltransferase family 1 protein [Spartobacteria bacterium]